MSRLAVTAVALAGAYVLAIGSPKPLDFALGAAIGGLLAVGLRRFSFDREPPGARTVAARLAGAPALAVAVARSVAVGTWQVALTSLGVRPLGAPGVVEVPIGERTESGVVATALFVTLSPGELLVDVDRERGVMLMHVLDATRPDEVRRGYDDFYRRYQRRVFP